MSDKRTRERRRIGRNGPEVLAVGLGCMSLSGTYGTSDDDEAIGFLHRAIEAGVDFLDSSDAYGFGQNEEGTAGPAASTAAPTMSRRPARRA